MGALFCKKKEKPKQNLDLEENEAINRLVNKYLKDALLDIPFIPKCIEKHLYTSVIDILIGVIKETLENAEIIVLEHKIKFQVTPIITPPSTSET